MTKDLDKQQQAIDGLEQKSVAVEIVCHRFSDEGWVKSSAHVPNEQEIVLYVNQKELVTILSTPTKLKHLVLGFLYGEGIISSIDDVLMLRMCDNESTADVRLKNTEAILPTKRTLTSGCGGGSMFETHRQKVDSGLVASPTEVLSLMKKFLEKMELYRLSGGVHTSALADNKDLLVVAEDIGRHNTLDKIQGECLMMGISTKDRLILTTGRISSEMLLKVAKMQAPVVVSRHSPTWRAVRLAHDLGITLVGHARGGRLQVYSHPERLGC